MARSIELIIPSLLQKTLTAALVCSSVKTPNYSVSRLKIWSTIAAKTGRSEIMTAAVIGTTDGVKIKKSTVIVLGVHLQIILSVKRLIASVTNPVAELLLVRRFV